MITLSDKVPILSVGGVERDEHKVKYGNLPKFSELKPVQKFAIVYILVGIASFLLGFFLEIAVLYLDCERCYRIKVSQIGCGLWCGVIFVGIGCAIFHFSKNQTIFSLVTQMTISTSAIIVALLQIVISIIAMVEDRNTHFVRDGLKPTNSYNRWDHQERRYYEHVELSFYLPVFIPNLLLTLLGFLILILFFIRSVIGCKTTCCDPHPVYLRVSLFEPVSTPTPSAYYPPYPMVVPSGQPMYAPGGDPTHQPIVMMSGNDQTMAYQTFQLVPVSHNQPPPTQTTNNKQ